jgi:nucleoside phosphorylase
MTFHPPDEERAIIEPAHVCRYRRAVAERILLFPMPEHLHAYLASVGADHSRSRAFGAATYYPPASPERPGAVSPLVGAPVAAAVVEELIELGARELVFFGIAGGIADSFRLGDCAAAESAFADEGVSRHYSTNDTFHPDPALLKKLEDHLRAHRLEPRPAAIWTTDAFYRETPSAVRRHAEAGRHLVEMEISALYCVAAYRRVAAAAIVVVSDELFTGRWRSGYLRPRYRLAVSRAIAALAKW